MPEPTKQPDTRQNDNVRCKFQLHDSGLEKAQNLSSWNNNSNLEQCSSQVSEVVSMLLI